MQSSLPLCLSPDRRTLYLDFHYAMSNYLWPAALM